MTPLIEFLTSLLLNLSLGVGALFVNVLLHELGHALPKMIWSKKKVTVFIGSLGDPRHSLKLRFGRLELFIKFNPFLWFKGLCAGGDILPVNKAIVVTAMGPLVSLVSTGVYFVLLRTIGPDERQTVVLVTLMVISGLITLWTAIPRGGLSPSHSGGLLNNDASKIVQLWKTRGLPVLYWEVLEKYHAKEYMAASDLAEKMIDEAIPNVLMYRQAVVVHLFSGRYERAGDMLELIRNRYRLSLEDQINDGCHKIMTGRYRHAIAIYTELLRLHYNHFLILNNMGYALIAAGEPDKALPYLDRGITLESRFSELHANKAWAIMELGEWEEGLAVARHALKLNPSSAEAYRVLGIYTMKTGQLLEAREHFLKARSLNPLVQVDERLSAIEQRLQTSLSS